MEDSTRVAISRWIIVLGPIQNQIQLESIASVHATSPRTLPSLSSANDSVGDKIRSPLHGIYLLASNLDDLTFEDSCSEKD